MSYMEGLCCILGHVVLGPRHCEQEEAAQHPHRTVCEAVIGKEPGKCLISQSEHFH